MRFQLRQNRHSLALTKHPPSGAVGCVGAVVRGEIRRIACRPPRPRSFDRVRNPFRRQAENFAKNDRFYRGASESVPACSLSGYVADQGRACLQNPRNPTSNSAFDIRNRLRLAMPNHLFEPSREVWFRRTFAECVREIQVRVGIHEPRQDRRVTEVEVHPAKRFPTDRANPRGTISCGRTARTDLCGSEGNRPIPNRRPIDGKDPLRAQRRRLRFAHWISRLRTHAASRAISSSLSPVTR